MAELTNITAPSIRTNIIRNAAGQPKVNIQKLASQARYSRTLITQVSTSSYSTSSSRKSFTLGPTFDVIPGFREGSIISVNYHIPVRNDTNAWGGFYVEPQVRFNEGSWHSLGGTGYDLMYANGDFICSYYNSLLFDPQQLEDFSVQFRFYFASYDGVSEVNSRHSINTTSGTAVIMTGDNGEQHYMSLIIEELATL